MDFEKILNHPMTPMVGSGLTIVGLTATSFLFVDGARQVVDAAKGYKYAPVEDRKKVIKKGLLGALKTIPFLALAGANIACALIQTKRLKGFMAAVNAVAATTAPIAAPLAEKAIDKVSDGIEEISKEGAMSTDEMPSDGELLFRDTLSGQTFKSTMANVNNAISLFNAAFAEDGTANLGEMLDYLDLEPSSLANEQVLYWKGNQSRVRAAFTPKVHGAGVRIDIDYWYNSNSTWDS